jgi:hypothetical protein
VHKLYVFMRGSAPKRTRTSPYIWVVFCQINHRRAEDPWTCKSCWMVSVGRRTPFKIASSISFRRYAVPHRSKQHADLGSTFLTSYQIANSPRTCSVLEVISLGRGNICHVALGFVFRWTFGAERWEHICVRGLLCNVRRRYNDPRT